MRLDLAIDYILTCYCGIEELSRTEDKKLKFNCSQLFFTKAHRTIESRESLRGNEVEYYLQAADCTDVQFPDFSGMVTVCFSSRRTYILVTIAVQFVLEIYTQAIH